VQQKDDTEPEKMDIGGIAPEDTGTGDEREIFLNI